jgi:DNA mismatch repair protein MutS
LAIAQAVVKYISLQVKARFLFATHYHELTSLQDNIPTIASYFAACQKTPHGIVFLYKILRGVADGSFGVEVAKLAQLPGTVISRPEYILSQLTQIEKHQNVAVAATTSAPADSLIGEYERIVKEYALVRAEIDCMRNQLREQEDRYKDLSPKKAFDILWQIKGE